MMKSFNDDIGASTFFWLLVTSVLVVLLIALLHRDAHGTQMELPRCNEARSLDQVREALEAQGDWVVLGLHTVSEIRTGADGDYRRCIATVVTSQGEAHIGFSIGWHDRRNGIPFWTGESL